MNGESIRLWRVKRLLTQKELAEKARIPETIINSWESGEMKPDKKTRNAILEALNNCHGELS